MNKLLRVFFVVLFSFLSFTVNAQLKQVVTIDTVAKAVYADNLDNIYLLTQQDELLKYDNKGVLRWRYSNNRFGRLSSVDVSDPMRVLLFYSDFQQVVVLNNNLNELTSYSFATNGNLLVAAVSSANNNSIWVFERGSNALLKLSSNFTEEIRSANLYQLFDRVVVPKKLLATDEYVFLQQQNASILQFDRFGGYLRELPIDSIYNFSIANNQLVYVVNNQLIKYQPNTFNVLQVQLPVQVTVKQVAVGNKLIAVLTEKAVFLLSDN